MKILVVDDHVLIREALRGLFKELKPDATVLEAPDAARTMQLLADQPDVALILLDLSLPDRDGLALLAEVRERYPGISVVVLSGFRRSRQCGAGAGARRPGLHPEVGRPRGDDERAEPGVLRRRLYPAGDPRLGQVGADGAVAAKRQHAATPQASPADLGLTGRQVDVLALMMQGKSNKAICRRLELAEPTVKNHVTAILKALGVSNRTEAVLAAAALGWELGGFSRRCAEAD